MFAYQNFLKQSCGKFPKQQKFFWSQFMKMCRASSKVAHKAEIRAVSNT